MFEQHPVPQNISSYQFRLVGDMTLKQFFELAAGAIVALLIYSAPLPTIIRWPLIIVSIISGAAFAFLPLQDRPLEQWFAAFFRSIYKPTVFYWSQPATKPKYFKDELTAKTQAAHGPGQPVKEKPEERKADTPFENKLDQEEEKLLANIEGALAGKEVTYQKAEETPKEPPPTPQPKPQIPQQPAQKVIQVDTKKADDQKQPPPQPKPQTPQNLQSPVVAQGQTNTAQQAQFSQTAAPSPPEQPNTIVGQVMDNQGKVVEAAILEIKDSLGRPVRALRSNQVGHFRIVTPLLDGEYTISTEKEGLNFNDVKFEAKGQIIQPIQIKAS